MKIKYAGPKVMFSKSGIYFDNNKDDKYTYINIAVQLFKAFSHEYTTDQIYIYDSSTKRLSDDEIMKEFNDIFSNSESLIEEASQKAQEYFKEEIKKADANKENLEEVEYETWIKNINLMEKYVIQRHFNKMVYLFLIDKVCECIREHNIKRIELPMYQNFVYVAHSIKDRLKNSHNPKSSNFDIVDKNGDLVAVLDIA